MCSADDCQVGGDGARRKGKSMTYENRSLVGWAIVGFVLVGMAWAIAWASVRMVEVRIEGGYHVTTHYERLYGE